VRFLCRFKLYQLSDSATVTVNVAAPSIDALNDTIAVANGTTGDDAGNVLADNGNGTDLTERIGYHSLVTLTITTPATAINGGNVPTINPSTGTVVVPQNTPAGRHTIAYQICDKLNPTIAIPQR
jgi:hypothetical protein